MAVEPLRPIEPNRFEYINQPPAAKTPELTLVPTAERLVPTDPEVVVETPEQIRQRELAEYRLLIADPGVGVADAWTYVKEFIREEYKEKADELLIETDPLVGGPSTSGDVLSAYHDRRRRHYMRKAKLLATISEKRELTKALSSEAKRVYPEALKKFQSYYGVAFIEAKKAQIDFIDRIYASTPIEMSLDARNKKK